MDSNASSQQVASIKDRYLTFILEDEKYGVEILSVKEIIALQKVVPIPQTPFYLKGVMNLRGIIIPIIDLRLKLSMQERKAEMHTAIIILKIHNIEIGFVVDEVYEVIGISQNELTEAPALGANVNTELIKHMAQVKKDVIIILDMEKALDDDEINNMKSFAKQEKIEEKTLETVEE